MIPIRKKKVLVQKLFIVVSSYSIVGHIYLAVSVKQQQYIYLADTPKRGEYITTTQMRYILVLLLII